MPKNTYRDTPINVHPEAIVTHTTVRIRGHQTANIGVNFARTEQTTLTVAWGGILLRFLSADAAQGVLEGFASARSLLIGLDNAVPVPSSDADTDLAVGRSTIELTWIRRPEYAAVHQTAHSKHHRRTVHWIDLHMGPVTWQILDHTGYQATLEVLRKAHRTAVGAFLDGGKHRADPTSDTYTPAGRAD